MLNTINSKDELKESYSSFQSKLSDIEPLVKIVDLMIYCKAKENIEETKFLKYRKYRIPKCECY